MTDDRNRDKQHRTFGTDDELEMLMAADRVIVTDDQVRLLAGELLRLRAVCRQDSRRAAQVRKLRWGVENLIVKIERLERDERAGGPPRMTANTRAAMMAATGEDMIKTLVWPNRGCKNLPTIGDVLLEAQSAGVITCCPGVGDTYALFDEGRVRYGAGDDIDYLAHHAAMLMPHAETLIEIKPTAAPRVRFRFKLAERAA